MSKKKLFGAFLGGALGFTVGIIIMGMILKLFVGDAVKVGIFTALFSFMLMGGLSGVSGLVVSNWLDKKRD